MDWKRMWGEGSNEDLKATILNTNYNRLKTTGEFETFSTIWVV